MHHLTPRVVAIHPKSSIINDAEQLHTIDYMNQHEELYKDVYSTDFQAY